MGNGQNGVLGWLINNWNKPAQGIAAISAALFSFFQPPGQYVALGDAQTTAALARVFIIPVVWLIMSVPARRYSEKRHTRHWLGASVVLFLLGLTVWFGHEQLYASWTCHSPVHGERFVHGRTFTREVIEGRKFLSLRRGLEITDEQAVRELESEQPCNLIDGSEKNPGRVWPAEELRFRKLIITTLYVAGLPVFVMALIAAVQAWYCAGREEPA